MLKNRHPQEKASRRTAFSRGIVAESTVNQGAMVFECPASIDCVHPTNESVQHFMADDYTWASMHGSHIYYAWCDRSDFYFSGRNSRRDPNIRLGKVKQ